MAIILSITTNLSGVSKAIVSPLSESKTNPVEAKGNDYEVFGFAPHWTLNKLDNVDFNTLTTLAYFGVPVNADGSLDKSDVGYEALESKKAQDLFSKARNHGTRVVLTFTQMNSASIRSIIGSEQAQERAASEMVRLTREKGFDGVNIDFEYMGNPGEEYRNAFSRLVEKTTKKLHKEIPNSKLSVSVYASAAKSPKMYDIARISKSSDSIFMMAYDFATTSADEVMPTAPLYGHKEKKYWYDISTAVEDFLKVMPADKLILGLPWYGYNYPVAEPGVKVARYKGYYYNYWWKRRRYTAFQSVSSRAQTYASALENTQVKEGWDDYGKVGWKAYREGNLWRIIFLEDTKSLSIKYRFVKDNKLAGVGMWALGFDNGRRELWDLLEREFGQKLADSRKIEEKTN